MDRPPATTVSVVGAAGSEHPWPREGFVAVVSAEAQQGVFLDVGLVERLPETSVLRAPGSTQWMVGEVVRDALVELIGLASDANERLAVTQAGGSSHTPSGRVPG